MEEYRFMVKQNYYPLLKKRYKERPFRSSLKIAIRDARNSNIGILAVAFSWRETPEGDKYWRTIYRKHYGKPDY
jgi:hypothetical protein